jgi:hypothetical protein
VELDAAAIATHVTEALGSPLFAKAERQARFLRFVVDAALQSPAPLVREFDIARAVYDRRDDYDPRVDPIVRVEAARLRARLREYDEGALPAAVHVPRVVSGPATGDHPLAVSARRRHDPARVARQTAQRS